MGASRKRWRVNGWQRVNLPYNAQTPRIRAVDYWFIAVAFNVQIGVKKQPRCIGSTHPRNGFTMEDTITYRTATAEDALAMCELGQLLNSVHHAARPDIYAAATEDVARDLPHWAGVFEKPGQVVFSRRQAIKPLRSLPPTSRPAAGL
jgi:hypothetical protein